MKRKRYVLQSCVIAVLAALALPIGLSAANAHTGAFGANEADARHP